MCADEQVAAAAADSWQLRVALDEERASTLASLLEPTCPGVIWDFDVAAGRAQYTFAAPPWLGLIDAVSVWLAALGADDAPIHSRKPGSLPGWLPGWRGWFHATRLSARFALALPGAAAEPGALHTLYLEPGGGFGSGHHPSTRLALALIDEALTERPPATLIDVGCGTGLMAIAAAKLGWSCLGVDIEPLALQRSRLHAEANGVADSCRWRGGSLAGGDRAEVVVANMPAGCLIDLGGALVAAAGRDLVLAGLDVHSRERVLAACPGLDVVDARLDGDWLGLWLRHRE